MLILPARRVTYKQHGEQAKAKTNMKKYISFYEFCDNFSEERKNTFSYNGKKALFDYLEQYEEDTGEEIELDIIALCCEYSEFENAVIASDNYGRYYDIDGTQEEKEASALEFLRNNTQVIEFDGGIIIQDF